MAATSPQKVPAPFNSTSPLQRARAGDQQEFYISQVKQEIYEMRQRQRDIGQVQDQIAYLEKKHRALQDEKVREREGLTSECRILIKERTRRRSART